jgi:hypothetical protein
MIAAALIGNLIGVWLQASSICGLGYAAGCLLAVWYARRESLLLVLTTPPLIFLITLAGAELITAHGGSAGSGPLATAEGTILMLAAVAPWLFGSTIGCLIVALARGLRLSIRELRTELTGRADLADPAHDSGVVPNADRGW